MPFTTGTIAEYDMVLSVSQEAINNQFEVLFNTPNPNNVDVMLIPSTMKLGYLAYDEDTGKMEPSQEGVTAQIYCPTVDISDVTETDGLYRSVRLSIKIDTGNITYWKTSGPTPKLVEYVVDGYTVTWVARLGRRDIQNIEEEAMPKQTKTAIKEALKQVPQEDFTPAALFCLFESIEVTSSFKMKDKDGKDVSRDSVAFAFVQHLTFTYDHMDPKDHPWVLGYSVSRKIKHHNAGTPLFFPVQFWISTSPNSDHSSRATLNFLLINKDEHNIDLVDPTKNPSAGILPQPFVNLTRSLNLSSDGFLAMSRNMFWKHWLKPTIMDQFSPTEIHKGTYSETAYSADSHDRHASKKFSWTKDWKEEGVWYERRTRHKKTGYYSITLDYSSVLQTNSGDISVDTKREVIINVKGDFYARADFQTALLIFTGWVDAGFIDSMTKWNFQLRVNAAEDGKWRVERTSWNVPGTTERGNHLNLWSILDMALVVLDLEVKGVLAGFTHLGETLSVSDFQTIAHALNSISTACIMPAGDVYTFLGLDCDDSGNLYSHVKYKTSLS